MSFIQFANYGQEREINLTREETEAVNIIFESLQNSEVVLGKLELIKKSDSYTTLVIKGKNWNSDLIRFKFTNRTKWISLMLSKSDRETFKDSSLFAAQSKKNQLHWRSNLISLKDLPKYKDLIVNSYRECVENNPDNFS